MSRFKIKHEMSTAYHPQTDGQTEWMDEILEEHLRHYIKTLHKMIGIGTCPWQSSLLVARLTKASALHRLS
jgi:hypothetical protein